MRAFKNTSQAAIGGLKSRPWASQRAMIARALTNQQIAAELAISPATARTHVEHVLTKLGLHTRAQVAVWANQTRHA
jgi:DNA-binding NarL/FixJ family response regulator